MKMIKKVLVWLYDVFQDLKVETNKIPDIPKRTEMPPVKPIREDLRKNNEDLLEALKQAIEAFDWLGNVINENDQRKNKNE